MTTSASWCSRRLSSRESCLTIDSLAGTEAVDVPLDRRCGGGDAVTPGGSSVIFVPENIVSIVSVVGRSRSQVLW
jgi:hypothetical protein